MKKKNYKRFFAAVTVLAVILPGSTGCGKMVESAVVAEKAAGGIGNGQTSAKGEEQVLPNGDAFENKDAETLGDTPKDGKEGAPGNAKGDGEVSQDADILTVPMQVQAPEIYTADFTETPEAKDRTEGSGMSVHIFANAAVEVPDVEAIRLKHVERTAGSMEKLNEWINLLSEGEQITGSTYPEETGDGNGKVTVRDIPYSFSYVGYDSGGEEISANQLFYWDIDWDKMRPVNDGFLNTETNVLVPNEKMKDLSEARVLAVSILEQMGFTDFSVCREELLSNVYYGRDDTYYNRGGFFQFERVVDGIPVTYVPEGLYPISPEILSQMADNQSVPVEIPYEQWWEQESLIMEMAAERLHRLTYANQLDISDYSDEKLFLLPFGEIKQIFEDTIGIRMAEGGKENAQNPGLSVYPDISAKSADVKITKVRLGYMRIREEGSATEGILIPVWDFIGYWTADVLDENGVENTERLPEPDASLLTIDARDGTIITRMRGY